jgi:hypothetical protein
LALCKPALRAAAVRHAATTVYRFHGASFTAASQCMRGFRMMKINEDRVLKPLRLFD